MNSSTTDWIQAISAAISTIITGAGTYAIVRTLSLQRETLESQKEVTKIEQNKFLLDIRPQFILGEIGRYEKEFGEYHVELHIKLQSNVAMTFFVHWRHFPRNQRTPIDTYNEHVAVGQDMTLFSFMGPKSAAHQFISVDLYYRDQAGNMYYQTLSGHLAYPTISPPMRAQEDKFNNLFNRMLNDNG